MIQLALMLLAAYVLGWLNGGWPRIMEFLFGEGWDED